MKYHKLVEQMVEHFLDKEFKKGNEEGIYWWQLSLIGIGSIIGAGFFLGTGLSISIAGPSVLIAYLIAGIVAVLTFEALAEMTVNDPDPGSFRSYSRKAFGPRMGFITGWMYWVAGVLIMSSEITALSIFTQYWFPNIPLSVFAVIYSLLGLGINLLGIKHFGRIESFFAIIKICTLIAFIGFVAFKLYAIGPPETNLAAKTSLFSKKALFPSGFKGMWAGMIFTLFSFGGIAVVGIASNEVKDKTNIPKSVKVLMSSLILLYIASLFLVLKVVPWNKIDKSESPFVTVLSNFNIPYVDSVLNFIIISAAFSTMVGALFAVTNVMLSLAYDNDAPRSLMKKNKKGVATKALFLSAVGLGATILLSYLLSKTVYEYMTTAAGVLLILNWGMILASQIKLRSNYYNQENNLKFKMIGYPYASYIGIFLIIFSVGGALFRKTERIGLFVSIGIICIIVLSYYLVKAKKA